MITAIPYLGFLTPSVVTASIGTYLMMVDSSSVDQTGNFLTAALDNTAVGDLLVIAVASENDSNSDNVVNMSSSPSYVWTQAIVADGVTNAGACEIWWAKSSGTGAISVISQWSSGGHHCAVLYRISGSEASPSGNTAKDIATNQPLMPFTSSRDNSIVIGIASDWNADNGTRTYRATPVSESYYVYLAGIFTTIHWWKQAATNGSKYGMGYTAPASTTNAINCICYEIRTP